MPSDAPSPGDLHAVQALGGVDVACVVQGDAGWWASAQPGVSALWRLVVGVREAVPDGADRILRARIGQSRPVAPGDRDLVKVAAKRVVHQVAAPGGSRVAWQEVGTLADAVLRETDLPTRGTPVHTVGEALDRADHLVSDQVSGPRAFQADRPVGAVLVAPDGTVLDGAANRASRHRLLHAEATLAWRWAAAGHTVPDGAWVAVSLAPCRMCQAWLARVGVERVVYRRDDPGRFAQVGPLRGTGRVLSEADAVALDASGVGPGCGAGMEDG